MRKLELGDVRRVGKWTLVPVELTEIRRYQLHGSSHFYASKEPHAVLLVRGDGAKLALDTEGREIPVSHLLEEVPALREILSDVGNLGRRSGL